jgi:hypothetical protein
MLTEFGNVLLVGAGLVGRAVGRHDRGRTAGPGGLRQRGDARGTIAV